MMTRAGSGVEDWFQNPEAKAKVRDFRYKMLFSVQNRAYRCEFTQMDEKSEIEYGSDGFRINEQMTPEKRSKEHEKEKRGRETALRTRFYPLIKFLRKKQQKALQLY